jgi:hypothetical protein
MSDIKMAKMKILVILKFQSDTVHGGLHGAIDELDGPLV